MKKTIVHTWKGKKETTDEKELKGKFYEVGEVDERGLQQGIWKLYDMEGRLSQEITMVDGKAIGHQAFYNKDGTKYTEGSWEEGRAIGHHIDYKNGKIKDEFNYVKGKLHGEQLYYNNDGTLRRKSYYIMGKNVSKEEWENRN